jgi:hypothetical protein
MAPTSVALKSAVLGEESVCPSGDEMTRVNDDAEARTAYRLSV